MSCMSRYSYALWNQLSEILEIVSEEKRSKDCLLQKGWMLLGKQLLDSVKHILDLFAKSVTSAVCLHQHACQHLTDLQPDAKAIIEGLPLKGEGLSAQQQVLSSKKWTRV